MDADMVKDSESNGRKGTIFKVFVSALIAGFSSLLPSIYTTLTAPEADLSYIIFAGPPIHKFDGYYRIFAVTIQNNGKIPLTSVVTQISIPDGTISDLVFDQSMLKPSLLTNLSGMTIPNMLPGERQIASVMTLASYPRDTLQVQARSDQVGASEQKQSLNAAPGLNPLVLIGALLSSASGVIISVYFTTRSKRRL